MAKPLHWAEDLADVTETACGLEVGFVLVELDDDVTPEPKEQFLLERAACRDCKDAIEEGTN